MFCLRKFVNFMYPSVAIIIVNWNNAKDTVDCIESIKKIIYRNYKIFLIDNGSGDGSFVKFQSLYAGISGIEILRLNENLGFSGGNNIGIKKALDEKFDYVLLLNNDTTVEPNFLDELIKIGESDEKIGVVGPKIYFHPDFDDLLKADRIWYGGGDFTWLGGGRHLQYEEIDKNPSETNPRETKYMTGCAFLVKSEVLKKVGLMPEEFFLYYEDTDWSLSIRKAGYKMIYAPASKIYHKVSRTTATLGNPKIHYYHTRNALLLSKRQAPKIILAGIYIWSVMHYLKQIIKLTILPSKRETSKMIMRGIEDFWEGKFGEYESK